MAVYAEPWEFDLDKLQWKRIVVDGSKVRIEYAQNVEPVMNAIADGDCGGLHNPDFQYVGSIPTSMVNEMMDAGVPLLGQDNDDNYVERQLTGDIKKFKGHGKF